MSGKQSRQMTSLRFVRDADAMKLPAAWWLHHALLHPEDGELLEAAVADWLRQMAATAPADQPLLYDPGQVSFYTIQMRRGGARACKREPWAGKKV